MRPDRLIAHVRTTRVLEVSPARVEVLVDSRTGGARKHVVQSCKWDGGKERVRLTPFPRSKL